MWIRFRIRIQHCLLSSRPFKKFLHCLKSSRPKDSRVSASPRHLCLLKFSSLTFNFVVLQSAESLWTRPLISCGLVLWSSVTLWLYLYYSCPLLGQSIDGETFIPQTWWPRGPLLSSLEARTGAPILWELTALSRSSKNITEAHIAEFFVVALSQKGYSTNCILIQNHLELGDLGSKYLSTLQLVYKTFFDFLGPEKIRDKFRLCRICTSNIRGLTAKGFVETLLDSGVYWVRFSRTPLSRISRLFKWGSAQKTCPVQVLDSLLKLNPPPPHRIATFRNRNGANRTIRSFEEDDS